MLGKGEGSFDELLARGPHSRKQFLAYGVAGAAAMAGMGVLAGCGDDDGGSATGTTGGAGGTADISGATLTMWAQPYGEVDDFRAFFREAGAAFKADTGASVNLEIVPWDTARQKWDLALSNGTVPDVGDIFYLQSRVVAGRGEWGPIDFKKDVEAGRFGDWDAIPEVVKTCAEYEGGIYGIPWGLHVRGFVYNSELWPEAPGDIAEFEAMAKRVRDTTDAAPCEMLAAGGAQSLGAIGGVYGVRTLTDDVTQSNLSDPRWEEALRWAQRMVTEGLMRKETVTSYTSEVSGRVPRIVNGRVASVFATYRSTKDEVAAANPRVAKALKASSLPASPDFQPFTYTGAQYYAAFENTSSPEACMSWLDFITKPENSAKIAKIAGELPPNLTVAREQFSDPYDLVFIDGSEVAVPIDEPSPAWAELSAEPEGPLTKLAVAVFNGEDVKSALSTADEAVTKILDSYA